MKNAKTSARIAIAVARLKVRELEGLIAKGSKVSKRLNAAIAKLNELIDSANNIGDGFNDFSIVVAEGMEGKKGKLVKVEHKFKRLSCVSGEANNALEVDSSSSKEPEGSSEGNKTKVANEVLESIECASTNLETNHIENDGSKDISEGSSEAKPTIIKPWWTNPELNIIGYLADGFEVEAGFVGLTSFDFELKPEEYSEGGADGFEVDEVDIVEENSEEDIVKPIGSTMVYSYYMAVLPASGFEPPKPPNQIEYCNFDMVEGMVNVLEAEKGTGKTQCFKRYLDTKSSQRVLVVSPRVSLNEGIALDLDYVCYTNVKDKHKLPLEDKLVSSPEHLGYVSYSDVVPYNVVVIDEAEQTLSHIVTSSTVRQKRLVLNTLAKLCNFADTVVLADANPSLCVSKFTEMLANEEQSVKPKKMKHHYNPCKPRLIRNDKFETVGSDIQWNAVLKSYALDKKRFVVICDTKAKTEAAYDMVIACGVDKSKVLLVNSDNNNSSEKIRELLENPKQYDVVIYSPTLGTGFSIEEHTHHFETGLAHFKGTSLAAEGCSQMLARFRGLGHYIGFIDDVVKRDKQDKLSVEYSELMNGYYDFRFMEGDKMARKGMFFINEYGKPETRFIDKMTVAAEAVRNLSNNDFRAHMLKVLKEEGFRVEPYVSSERELELELIASQPKAKQPKIKQPNPLTLKETARIVMSKKEQLEEHNRRQAYVDIAEGTIVDTLEDRSVRDMLVLGVINAIGIGVSIGLEFETETNYRDVDGDLLIEHVLLDRIEALKPLYKEVTGKELEGNKNTMTKKLIEYVGLTKRRKRLSTGKRSWVHIVDGSGIDELITLTEYHK